MTNEETLIICAFTVIGCVMVLAASVAILGQAKNERKAAEHTKRYCREELEKISRQRADLDGIYRQPMKVEISLN